jgi:hypothetical protein
MHPVIDEMLAGSRLRLRDLVFMVRKFQIEATAVDIEVVAQTVSRHRRAFDVPPRPACPPGRWPARFISARGLPQGKVGRIAFLLSGFRPLTRAQILEPLARKMPIVRKGADGVVHVTARLIGITPLDEALDHGND